MSKGVLLLAASDHKQVLSLKYTMYVWLMALYVMWTLKRLRLFSVTPLRPDEFFHHLPSLDSVIFYELAETDYLNGMTDGS